MGKDLGNGKLGKIGIQKDNPSGVNEVRHFTIRNKRNSDNKVKNPLAVWSPTAHTSLDDSKARLAQNAHSLKDKDILPQNHAQKEALLQDLGMLYRISTSL